MALSHAVAFVRASAKRWQGYVWAGRLSREILVIQGADALKRSGRPCPHGGCASHSDGTTDGPGEADAVASKAKGKGFNIPANHKITFFLDIEPQNPPTGACIKAYADEIESKGFRAGFYGGPSVLQGPFCSEIHDKHVADAVLWSPVKDRTDLTYSKLGSPNFNPAHVSCSGNTDIWQSDIYGSSSWVIPRR